MCRLDPLEQLCVHAWSLVLGVLMEPDSRRRLSTALRGRPEQKMVEKLYRCLDGGKGARKMKIEVVFDDKEVGELMGLLDISDSGAIDARLILGKLKTMADSLAKQTHERVKREFSASHSSGSENVLMQDVQRRRRAVGLPD